MNSFLKLGILIKICVYLLPILQIYYGKFKSIPC